MPMMISSGTITLFRMFIGSPKSPMPPTVTSAVMATAPSGRRTPGAHRNDKVNRIKQTKTVRGIKRRLSARILLTMTLRR
jgi:hypothetical protein